MFNLPSRIIPAYVNTAVETGSGTKPDLEDLKALERPGCSGWFVAPAGPTASNRAVSNQSTLLRPHE